MTMLMVILSFALITLSIGAIAFYGMVLWRMRRVARTLPTARDGLDLPAPGADGSWPRLCLIVPAHNEQDVIAELARSLVAQDYPGIRVVFALDRCTDDTEKIVREIVGADPRFEVLLISQCPEDWSGKTHALWRGVQDSVGARDAELLMFADADTVFDPGLARATVALMGARKLDLLSLLSRLTCDAWFERLIQPAAGFELVRQYPLDYVNRANRPRAFANGQFMLFRRELYERIGGHEAVKQQLLEDIALARLLDKRKRKMPSRWGVLMPGDGKADPEAGMLHCHMYRNWNSFRRGWKRIYSEAALRRPAQLIEWAWRLRLTGVVLPVAPLVCLLMAVWTWRWDDVPLTIALVIAGVAGMIVAWAALGSIYRDQRARLSWLPLYPVGAWRTAGLLLEAARDLRTGEPTMWAGRAYKREVTQ